MPTTIRKLCAKAGCTTLVPLGQRHCPSHAATETHRRNQRVKAYGYGSRNWQQITTKRRLIANGQCELGLPGCTIIATHTHLDPRLNGNHRAATIYDARACCANCSGAIDAPRATHRGAGVNTHHPAASATHATSPREKR